MSAMPDTTDTAVVAPPSVTIASPPPSYPAIGLSPCRAGTKHYRCGL